jgi:alkylated DNA repair dioxygenase AlkB
MVDRKLATLTGPTDKLVESIQTQLSAMTKEISDLRERQPAPQPPPLRGQFLPQPSRPPPKPQVKTENVEGINLKHSTKHVEALVENYISEEEERELMNLLEGQEFTEEGGRSVAQYGEHYKYMGSRTKPKPLPDPIKAIMNRLNAEYGQKNQDDRFHYTLNSCLVNRYGTKDATLPKHADNEGDIDPKSSILTLSLGAARHIHFQDLQTGEETSVLCNSRSLYEMTRHSQDFHKHSILSEEGPDADAVRYSLTFRAIHWSNFNSTALIGDSNFGPIKFGTGKGKVGGSTPGQRFWAPTIEKVDPLCCTSYKNVVIMVGTNDLKHRITDDQITELYKNYKTKISLIRKYNKKCRIFVCPVLPTKIHDINRRVNIFNKLIFEDLVQCNLDVVLVSGFIKFLDRQSNLLSSDLSKDDELHLDGKGVSILVGLIKDSIFRSRKRNTINSPRLYSNTLRGGPPHPVV